MKRMWFVLAVGTLIPVFGIGGWRAAAVADDTKEAAASARDDKETKVEKKTPAKGDKKDEASVAVFRWNGELSEPPPQEDLFSFGPQGESLKDLVARMRKAA